MSRSSTRAPSKRSRYWSRPVQFTFRWHEGRVRELATGLRVPCSTNTFVIGRGPKPGDTSNTYYFSKAGEPLGATERRLHDDMRIEYFVQFGRFHPPFSEVPTSNDLHDWNRCLAMRGQGTKPRTPPATRKTPLWRIPPSAWRRLLVARLSVLLDTHPNDSSLQKLAGYLTRTEKWHEWWYDESLTAIRAKLKATSRWPFVRRLESIAARRGQIAWSRRVRREPALYNFRHRGKDYRFRVGKKTPKESERSHMQAVLAVKALTSLDGRRRKKCGAETLAAVTWLARRFVTEPRSWSGRPPTRAEIGEHFGVSLRRLRYLTDRIAKHSMIGFLPIEDLLRDKRVKQQGRVGPGTLLSSEVTRLPEGQEAMKMYDEASELEHGWKWLDVDPPTPFQIGRARRLRKRALAFLERLHQSRSIPEG